MKTISIKTWLRSMWLVVGCLAVTSSVQAASITVNGINYTTSGNKATVAKYSIDKSVTPYDTLFYTGDIVIPEKIIYENVEYTVVATAANAFVDCKDVTTITLPATCVTIGRNCFKGCSSLTNDPIPATATSVGSGVFNGCSSLEQITIVPGWSKPISEEFANCPNLKRLIIAEGPNPVVMKVNAFGANAEARVAINSIEYIYMGRNVDASAYFNNEQPFHNLGSLNTLIIGGETTTIQSTTFQGCTALQNVTFEEGNKVSAIGSSAFASCTSLNSIDIPAAVTTIEQSTFNGCHNLRNVTMGDVVTSIGITAFYNTGITSITIPNALTSIGQSAFENSKLQNDIVLPEGLTAIGTQAFAGTQLTGVSIPASVTSIGQGAFAPIPTLANITLTEGNANFQMDDGVLLNAAGNRLLVTAHEGNLATTYSNPAVTTIDNYGLAYAPFTSVDLPALATIGNYGFAYSNIDQFTLDETVTVGQNAFAGSALTAIVIGEGRNEIPQGLCRGCLSLTSVTLATTTTTMMSNCFEGCTDLENMEIPANINYMEPGSVPATIKSLRVLNVNPPTLASGVFNKSHGNVICKVAPSSVNAFKFSNQWRYLNIVADETISGEGSILGCPTGLYFATTDGSLMYKDVEGNIVNTNFNAGQHAFTLQNYKNRIYVAVAGKNFTYQDPNQPLGDGELFYVNNTNGIFYRVTVLNNVGGNPSEDPFTMSIDKNENKIYISDRNVGIHELSADATGLYGSQPFLLKDQWLPYYIDEISWGSITGGFTQDKHGIFWMSKKFNGLCLLRFKKSDIYSGDGGGAGKPKSYNALFKDAIIKTFYLDDENGYLYMQVQTDPYGCVPGIYRIALSKIEDMETGADVPGNENLRIADCELIDSSPIKSEGQQPSGEIANVAQINSDGNYIYWSYIAPAEDSEAIANSVPLDPENPLHKSGIKCIAAKPNADGIMPTTISFAIEGIETYGVCSATYTENVPVVLIGDVDNDGKISIADVTTIIDYLLTDDKSLINALATDCDQDGIITIADATILIDYLLTESWGDEHYEHEYVDLGLPSGTLWAKMNVGATKPEDYGYIFAWGEINTKSIFDLDTYKWFKSVGYYDYGYTKYCTMSSYGYHGFVDNKTELDTEDDAAFCNWSPSWRIPTKEQLLELYNECSWQWTQRNGVNGQLVTGPNGNSMFLPAQGSSGNYCSRSLVSYYPPYAYYLYINSDFHTINYCGNREDGYAVRAVRISQTR